MNDNGRAAKVGSDGDAVVCPSSGRVAFGPRGGPRQRLGIWGSGSAPTAEMRLQPRI